MWRSGRSKSFDATTIFAGCVVVGVLVDNLLVERVSPWALHLELFRSRPCHPGARVLYAGPARCRAGKVYTRRRRVASRFVMSAPVLDQSNAGEQAEERQSRKREHSTVDEDREKQLESDEVHDDVMHKERCRVPLFIVRTKCLEAAMTRLFLSKNKS